MEDLYPGGAGEYCFNGTGESFMERMMYERHSRSLLSGNPVFLISSGCPIKDFGHDEIENL